MGRYYLNFRQADGSILPDEEGSELPSLQAAHDQALDVACEILMADMQSGWNSHTEAVILADEQGHDLDSVRLTEVTLKGFQLQPALTRKVSCICHFPITGVAERCPQSIASSSEGLHCVKPEDLAPFRDFGFSK
jgi:hypothetical protein